MTRTLVRVLVGQEGSSPPRARLQEQVDWEGYEFGGLRIIQTFRGEELPISHTGAVRWNGVGRKI